MMNFKVPYYAAFSRRAKRAKITTFTLKQYNMACQPGRMLGTAILYR